MQKVSYDLSLKSFNHNITPYIQKASDSSDRERQIFSISRKKFALERGKIAKKHVESTCFLAIFPLRTLS